MRRMIDYTVENGEVSAIDGYPLKTPEIPQSTSGIVQLSIEVPSSVRISSGTYKAGDVIVKSFQPYQNYRDGDKGEKYGGAIFVAPIMGSQSSPNGYGIVKDTTSGVTFMFNIYTQGTLRASISSYACDMYITYVCINGGTTTNALQPNGYIGGKFIKL